MAGRRGKQPAEQPVSLVEAITDAEKPLLDLIARRERGKRFTESEEEVILQLLAINEDNIHRVAGKTGLAVGTIWGVRARNMVALADVRERWKRQHALMSQDLAQVIAAKALVAVETQDQSFRDLMVGWGIAVQRGAELAGDATQTIRVERSLDPATLAALQALSERWRQLPAGEEIPAVYRVVEE